MVNKKSSYNTVFDYLVGYPLCCLTRWLALMHGAEKECGEMAATKHELSQSV